MADVSVVFNAIGRDAGVTGMLNGLKGAFRSTGATGAAAMAVVDKEVNKLDRDIKDAKDSLQSLTREFVNAGTAAEKAALSKAMAKQSRELATLNRAKATLTPDDVEVPGGTSRGGKKTKAKDLLPDPAEFLGRGVELGDAFSSGFISKVGDPRIAAAIAGGILAVGPVISTTLAGAVIGGAGIGGVVGGFAIAMQDSRVQKAVADLKKTVGTGLQESAAVFVPAAITAVNSVSATFRTLQPTLRGIFADSARYVAPLQKGITDLIQRMAPGIASLVKSAGPVISAISDGLGDVGQSLGGLFQMFSKHADSAAIAVRQIFSIISATIDVISVVVDAFAKIYEFALKIGQSPLLKWTGFFDEVADKSTPATQGMFDFQSAVDATGKAAETAEEKIARMVTETDALTDSNLSAYEAQTRAKDAIVKTTAELKKNGDTHDINTKKGRANRDALVELASSFNRVTDANDKAGVAAEKSLPKYEQQRRALIKAAESAGYAHDEAVDFADSVLHIPKAKATNITANTAKAKSNVSSLVGSLNRIDRNIFIRISTNAGSIAGAAAMKLAGRLAGGGPMRANLPYLVGEEGPELVVPTIDGHVMPADQTRRTLSGRAPAAGPGTSLGMPLYGAGRSGGGMNIYLHGERRVVELMRYLIRSTDMVSGAIN